MKLKGRVTFSKPSYGDDRKKISIQVTDSISRNRFLELEIDYDEFTQGIFGLAERPCDLDCRGLEFVDKRYSKWLEGSDDSKRIK